VVVNPVTVIVASLSAVVEPIKFSPAGTAAKAGAAPAPPEVRA
jgi:hypothetical protein